MRNYDIKMHQFKKDSEIEWHSGEHMFNDTKQSTSHFESILHWTHRFVYALPLTKSIKTMRNVK